MEKACPSVSVKGQIILFLSLET